MRIAVRGTAGERKWIGRFVRSWVVEMLTLYNDISSEDGCLRPLVAGGVYDQPAREWTAMRLIRAAYADERQKQADAAKRKR